MKDIANDEIANPLLADDCAGDDPRAGLSSATAAARLAAYGRNEVPVEKPSKLRVFLRQFEGPMPMMLMLACVLSAAVEDWEDFGIIAAMLLLNATIAFYEESMAMAALDALQGKLRQEVSVLRDGVPVSVDVALLVPGDVVALRGGQCGNQNVQDTFNMVQFERIRREGSARPRDLA